MLKEMIEKIVELSRQGSSVQIVETGPKTTTGYLNGAKVFESTKAPRKRQERVGTFQSFCEAVRCWKSGNSRTVIHIEGTCVRAVIDDDLYRENEITWEFRVSAEYASLVGLPQKGMSQKQLILWLRSNHTCSGSAKLLSAIRTVQFGRRSDGKRTIEHGKESLGRSVEAAVQSPEGLPEEFELMVPYFEIEFTQRYPVQVRLEIDPDNELFYLIVVPGSRESVPLRANEFILGILNDEFSESENVVCLISEM